MKRMVAGIVLFLICAAAASVFAQTGVKKKRPLPQDYGRVAINNFSEKAGMPGVVFDHWLHRTRYTCRVCHVDLGFGMKAGSTGVRAADNMKGFYCGACHREGGKAFASCSRKFEPAETKRCERCHSLDRPVKREHDFAAVTEKFPKERFGNGIDWEKAEADGLIKPLDFIEGLSIKKPGLAIQKDFSLNAKVEGMPEIIFSHKKHTVWNGCEVCHPEIFIGVKKGSTKYSMVEIFDGKYCGVCHATVAFPLMDCQRCHIKPVQQ